MKKTYLKPFITFFLIMTISLFITACGKKLNNDNEGISGKVIIASGSTALQPLVEKATQQFILSNPHINVQIQGGGSGTGLAQVAEGLVDIGNSDIYAEDMPGIDAQSLVDHKVCVVSFCTVVNPKNTVDNLTQNQLISIFTGKIINWNEVGGSDRRITIITRSESSGTRVTFKKYALNGAEEAVEKAITEDSSEAVKKAVVQNEGAIAYLANPYIDNSIKALKFNNIEATTENVTTGQYPIWSYEHMYTRSKTTGATNGFINYILSNEVQNKLIPQLGFIPLKEMKVSR